MWSLLALALAPVAAQDASAPKGLDEGTRVLTLQAGLSDSPSDDPREILFWSGKLGMAQRFRDRFALVGELDAAVFDGDPSLALPDADTTGLGASVFLRWHALSGRRWSLFLEHGLGLLATQDAFPPGGSGLNGTRQVGAGLAFELVPGTNVTVGLRQTHLSNGRGMDADNPSWDGTGLYVGLALDRTPAGTGRAAPSEFEAVTPLPLDLRLDGFLGDEGDDLGAGARLALDGRLAGRLHGGVRASLSDLDGESLSELGLSLYVRSERGLVGLAYDRQELDAFADDEWTLFAELYANDLVTVAGSLRYEDRNLFDDLVAGGMLLRVYPFDWLMVASGIGLSAERDEVQASDLDVPLSLEVAPQAARRAGLALFLVDDLEDARRIGLRWRPMAEGGASLIELHRKSSPLRDQL